LSRTSPDEGARPLPAQRGRRAGVLGVAGGSLGLLFSANPRWRAIAVQARFALAELARRPFWQRALTDGQARRRRTGGGRRVTRAHEPRRPAARPSSGAKVPCGTGPLEGARRVSVAELLFSEGS